MRLSNFFRFERKKFSMEDTIRKTSTETDFKFDSSGFDQSISDFQGHLGCRVFNRLEKDASCRFNNKEDLSQVLSDIPWVHEIKVHNVVNKAHFIRFPILVGENKRDSILSMLLDFGIEASPMYIEHGMNINVDDYPGAARVASELLTLPCHPYVNSDDIRLICEVFVKHGRV